MSEVAQQTTGWTAIVVIVAYAIRSIWRRYSRDQVEVATDRAERSMLSRLEAEVMKAYHERNEAYEERNELLKANAALSREVHLLRERVEQMTIEVRDLRNQLYPFGKDQQT